MRWQWQRAKKVISQYRVWYGKRTYRKPCVEPFSLEFTWTLSGRETGVQVEGRSYRCSGKHRWRWEGHSAGVSHLWATETSCHLWWPFSSCSSQFTKHFTSTVTYLTLAWSRWVFWAANPPVMHLPPFQFLLLPGFLWGRVIFSSYTELSQKMPWRLLEVSTYWWGKPLIGLSDPTTSTGVVTDGPGWHWVNTVSLLFIHWSSETSSWQNLTLK